MMLAVEMVDKDERDLVDWLGAVLKIKILDGDDADPKENRPSKVTPHPSSGLLSFRGQMLMKKSVSPAKAILGCHV